MNLQVLPLQLQDFETLISHADVYPPGFDLVGPPTPLCCEVHTKEEGQARLKFHFDKQKDRFLNDPTVRYMKVIDPSDNNNSIISIARWHYYPNGYDFSTQIHWETHNLPVPGQQQQQQEEEEVIPKGFNIPLHNHILTTRDAARSAWLPEGEPAWILMHMVTHPSHRGKGAAGYLIRWGIEQAERGGVPAYLEAGVMGKPIYERFGFVQAGELLNVDLRSYGVDKDFVMCKMVYLPRGLRNDGEGEKGGEGVLG